jgi:isoamylase
VESTKTEVWPGQAYPLGAIYDGVGTNFTLFSEVAARVELCLFDDRGGTEQRLEMPEAHGNVWHMLPSRNRSGTALRLPRTRTA